MGQKTGKLTLPSLNGINDTVSYAGYLASAYLDSHVNQERTGFHIYEETDALFNQQPSISEIDDEALKSTAEYLAPYIEPVRQQKMTQIGEYVERVAPQYRPLLRYRPDAIERIPAGLNEDKLDQHLYELSKQLETEAHKQAHQLLEEQQHATADEDIVAKYQRFLEG